jgi:uncharacterized protein YndB with AHSA1/START domain
MNPSTPAFALASLLCTLPLFAQTPLAPAPDPAAPAVPAAAVPKTRTLTLSTDLGVPPATIFAGFTTAEGIKKHWFVAKAKVDFRVGGTIRTCYEPEGDVDAPTAIINTILAYEPDRMLAIKPTAPQGSPVWLQKICESGWSVLRIEPIGDNHSRLTLTGMGYPEAGIDPDYDKAYEFFQKGDRWTLDKLAALYPIAPKPAADDPTAVSAVNTPQSTIELNRFVAAGPVPVGLHKEAVVNATPDVVFKLWTTREGFKKFLGVDGDIDLRIGGPMELYFGPNNPPGQRGSDGCQILSYQTDRMLSYSWNAPPKFPEEREKRTWIVIHFTPVDGGKTKVEFDHMGFGPSGQGHWDEVRAYFDNAWTRVLKALESHLAAPSGDGAGTSKVGN